MAERQVSFHDLKHAVLKAKGAEPYLAPLRPVQPGTTCWRLESESLDGDPLTVGVDLTIDHLGAHALVLTVF